MTSDRASSSSRPRAERARPSLGRKRFCRRGLRSSLLFLQNITHTPSHAYLLVHSPPSIYAQTQPPTKQARTHSLPPSLPTQPSPQRHSTSPSLLPLHTSKHTQRLEAMSFRLVSLATALLAASKAVHAIGDFPCSGSTDSQSCAAWSVDPNAQGTISATAVCQPGAYPRKQLLKGELTRLLSERSTDPINTSMSYCGYAHAACTTGTDCDYGEYQARASARSRELTSSPPGLRSLARSQDRARTATAQATSATPARPTPTARRSSSAERTASAAGLAQRAPTATLRHLSLRLTSSV